MTTGTPTDGNEGAQSPDEGTAVGTADENADEAVRTDKAEKAAKAEKAEKAEKADENPAPEDGAASGNQGAAPGAVTAVDPRLLVRQEGFKGYANDLLRRLRTGELGSIPVIVGLIVIAIVFQLQDSAFLSANNLSDLFIQSAGTGLIAVGIVFVLILGEIDLSVGSVSGMSAAVLAVLNINHGMNEVLALVLAILTGMAAGAVHGFFFARIGVPAFVVTLAGLLGWNGLMLQILGPSGTINLDDDGVVAQLTNHYFADKAAAMGLATVCVLAFLGLSLLDARRRKAVGVPSRPLSEIVLRTVVLAVPAYAAAFVFNSYKGLPLAVVIFIGVVVIGDFVLRRTSYGRKVFAVGGSSEAAGRAGINVPMIRITVYSLAGTMAAIGGMFFASQINAANQSSGAGSLLMNCIAAAVIGGTSLFGGRGKTWSALLGALVIQSINSGMALLGTGSAVRDMITGAVLLAAVVIDSVSRRTQKTAGRA
ncbi:sugar ABC transporter permease [Streptomyces sp. NBC_01795]|uniref:sugar ABC transporter permease n=1 Tax=Streptomyces sp. NBC_01795 TaxID=2975943 RepID=UPI002DDBCAD8|nr:sugar ABC transporter permease [Streptomyces sp. NBC_01795]WSA91808.1 sugar ABC transporter permease [Streptomyces sp. NBC_01795]